MFVKLVWPLVPAFFLSKSSRAEYPWTYDNDLFGGPDFWGLLDKRWRMCSKGKMQSPINIDPSVLLYDPHLTPLSIDNSPFQVNSDFFNIGQMPRIRVQNQHRRQSINISGASLKPYKYRLQRIDIHFGRGDLPGSEHTIDARRLPMELQFVAYNVDLYRNFSTATVSPHGIAIISVLVKFGSRTNDELQKLTAATAKIPFKRRRTIIPDFRPWRMLPRQIDYITYEGSLTVPGCYETATWIIINQPIFISPEDLELWSNMQQTVSREKEPRYISPNYRVLQASSNRIIRTNIRHRFKTNDKHCKKHLNDTWYRLNSNITMQPNVTDQKQWGT